MVPIIGPCVLYINVEPCNADLASLSNVLSAYGSQFSWRMIYHLLVWESDEESCSHASRATIPSHPVYPRHVYVYIIFSNRSPLVSSALTIVSTWCMGRNPTYIFERESRGSYDPRPSDKLTPDVHSRIVDPPTTGAVRRNCPRLSD